MAAACGRGPTHQCQRRIFGLVLQRTRSFVVYVTLAYLFLVSVRQQQQLQQPQRSSIAAAAARAAAAGAAAAAACRTSDGGGSQSSSGSSGSGSQFEATGSVLVMSTCIPVLFNGGASAAGVADGSQHPPYLSPHHQCQHARCPDLDAPQALPKAVRGEIAGNRVLTTFESRSDSDKLVLGVQFTGAEDPCCGCCCCCCCCCCMLHVAVIASGMCFGFVSWLLRCGVCRWHTHAQQE